MGVRSDANRSLAFYWDYFRGSPLGLVQPIGRDPVKYPSTPDEALDLLGDVAHVPIREQRRPDRERAYVYALANTSGDEREAVRLAGEILGLAVSDGGSET